MVLTRAWKEGPQAKHRSLGEGELKPDSGRKGWEGHTKGDKIEKLPAPKLSFTSREGERG